MRLAELSSRTAIPRVRLTLPVNACSISVANTPPGLSLMVLRGVDSVAGAPEGPRPLAEPSRAGTVMPD